MNEICCKAESTSPLMGGAILSPGPVDTRLVCDEDCGDEDCEREVAAPCGDCCCEKDSLGRIRGISINQVNYGYIVKIDCHTFVFETAEHLIEKLGVYLKEPNKTEKSWYKGTLL